MKLNISTDDVKVERKPRGQNDTTVELFRQFDEMHKSKGWKTTKKISIVGLTDDAVRSTVASALRSWATKRQPYGAPKPGAKPSSTFTVKASKTGTVKLTAKGEK